MRPDEATIALLLLLGKANLSNMKIRLYIEGLSMADIKAFMWRQLVDRYRDKYCKN